MGSRTVHAVPPYLVSARCRRATGPAIGHGIGPATPAVDATTSGCMLGDQPGRAASRFRAVTLPALKPTVFLVLTLGLIGTWQVFEQVYILSQSAPAKTTLTPAYLSYQTSFQSGKWGQGAAIAFILFAIIVVFSLLQRFVMRARPCRAVVAVASPLGRANDHHDVRTAALILPPAGSPGKCGAGAG